MNELPGRIFNVCGGMDRDRATHACVVLMVNASLI